MISNILSKKITALSKNISLRFLKQLNSMKSKKNRKAKKVSKKIR